MKNKLIEYGEAGAPAPKKRLGRPPKNPDDFGAPKPKYTKRKSKVIDNPDDHATYVLNQERQKLPALQGNKPTRVLKQDTRVTKYLIGDSLIDRIAGGELLKEILTEPDMPTFIQVQRWRRDNLYNFEERYQWALQSQAEAMADDIIILADGARDPRDKRIMFDARKFVAGHRHPERWGERMTVGGDPKNPLMQMNVRVEIASLSDSELAALEAFALARKQAAEAPASLEVPYTEIVTDEDSE